MFYFEITNISFEFKKIMNANSEIRYISQFYQCLSTHTFGESREDDAGVGALLRRQVLIGGRGRERPSHHLRGVRNM